MEIREDGNLNTLEHKKLFSGPFFWSLQSTNTYEKKFFELIILKERLRKKQKKNKNKEKKENHSR